MGEAKQRRLAKAAGRPWERDISKQPPLELVDGQMVKREPYLRPPILAAMLLAMASLGGAEPRRRSREEAERER